MLNKHSPKKVLVYSAISMITLYLLMSYFGENTNSSTGGGLFPTEFFLSIFAAIGFMVIPTVLNIVGIKKVILDYRENTNKTTLINAIFSFMILQLIVIIAISQHF